MKVTAKFASVEGGAVPASASGASLQAIAGGLDPASMPRIVGAWHSPHAENDVHPGAHPTRQELLRTLHREKRRADRSHSALSLVVLEIGRSDVRALGELLEQVEGLIRETDLVAPIDDEGVAVVLPDTGEAGLRTFLDRVALARPALVVSTTSATYPDAHFDRLVTDRLSTPRSRQPAHDQGPLFGPSRGYALKRALDLVGAVVALALLSPLMLLVALAIKLTSPGPVIFRQERIGRGGVPFMFYKFRSMRVDNDDRAHREFVSSLIDGKAGGRADGSADKEQFKMKSDPRVTAIGRFIRRTSIDELPQFYNVLVGDMSLVGPRPPVPYEAERYKGWHRRRVLELKPGLTGIWQVEGRSRVSFDDMVRMDLRYLQRCSLTFDLAILMRTVGAVVTCKGAR